MIRFSYQVQIYAYNNCSLHYTAIHIDMSVVTKNYDQSTSFSGVLPNCQSGRAPKNDVHVLQILNPPAYTWSEKEINSRNVMHKGNSNHNCLDTQNKWMRVHNIHYWHLIAMTTGGHKTVGCYQRVHCVPKSRLYPFCLLITSTEMDQFLKFFHQLIREKILYVCVTKISTSPAICCYNTLCKSKIQKCYWFW